MKIERVNFLIGHTVRVALGFKEAPPEALGVICGVLKSKKSRWLVEIEIKEHRGLSHGKKIKVSHQRFNASFELVAGSP